MMDIEMEHFLYEFIVDGNLEQAVVDHCNGSLKERFIEYYGLIEQK